MLLIEIQQRMQDQNFPLQVCQSSERNCLLFESNFSSSDGRHELTYGFVYSVSTSCNELISLIPGKKIKIVGEDVNRSGSLSSSFCIKMISFNATLYISSQIDGFSKSTKNSVWEEKKMHSYSKESDGIIEHTYAVVFLEIVQIVIFHGELIVLIDLNNGSWHQFVIYRQFEVFGKLKNAPPNRRSNTWLLKRNKKNRHSLLVLRWWPTSE